MTDSYPTECVTREWISHPSRRPADCAISKQLPVIYSLSKKPIIVGFEHWTMAIVNDGRTAAHNYLGFCIEKSKRII